MNTPRRSDPILPPLWWTVLFWRVVVFSMLGVFVRPLHTSGCSIFKTKFPFVFFFRVLIKNKKKGVRFMQRWSGPSRDLD